MHEDHDDGGGGDGSGGDNDVEKMLQMPVVSANGVPLSDAIHEANKALSTTSTSNSGIYTDCAVKVPTIYSPLIADFHTNDVGRKKENGARWQKLNT